MAHTSCANPLAHKIATIFRDAVSAGHAVFTPTTSHSIRDPLLPHATLQVLYAPSLAKKNVVDRDPVARKKNPFLPYDQNLFIDFLGQEHVLLLNKFPVTPEHVLVVTKAYQDQSLPLARKDFEALALTFDAVQNPFAFYNCGVHAGCSQPHRHIQVFPQREPLPLNSLIPPSPAEAIPGLPYAHYLAHLSPKAGGSELFAAYEQALRRMHARFPSVDHNMLMTRDWMVLVPRRTDAYANVSANAVGYAGCVLVAREDDLHTLQRDGLIRYLLEMGFPRHGNPDGVVPDDAH